MNKAIFAAYTLLITFLSLQTTTSLPIQSWDKLSHFLTYGVFAILAYGSVKTGRAYMILCALIIAYGGLMEIAQSFVPGREMSVYDFIANTLGVFIGIFVVKLLGNWIGGRAGGAE